MPADPSPSQSEASRANGARGRGPRSEAGKERSSHNAERHGFASERFHLRDGEVEAFAFLRDDHTARHEVETADGHRMVEALARVQLLHLRLDELELDVLDSELEPAPSEDTKPRRPRPSLATLARYRLRLSRREEELRSDLYHLRSQRARASAPPEPAFPDLAEILRSVTPRPARPPEPRPAPHSAQVGTSEPEPARATAAPAPPPSRHERRRQEALARKATRKAA